MEIDVKATLLSASLHPLLQGYLKQPAESNEFFIRLKEGLESQNQMTIGSKVVKPYKS